MSWPDGGPWLVAVTSTSVDWEVAAAALCVASAGRTAVLRIVVAGPGHGIAGDGSDDTADGTADDGAADDGAADDGAADDGAADDGRSRGHSGALLLHDNLDTYVEVAAGGVDGLLVADVVGLVQALTRTHELVLVGGGHGLAVPLGCGGWTLADLAWALPAPVVLLTGPGPDAVNHTTLALEVLTGRGITASVVALGPEEFGALPVTLAGRIPADAADRPERFRAEAAGWLDPLLHATRGRPATRGGAPAAATAVPAGEDAAATTSMAGHATRSPVPLDRATARSTVSGKRVLVVLLAVFLVSLLLLCGLTLATGQPTQTAEVRIFSNSARVNTGHPVPTGHVVPEPVPTVRPSRPPATIACPQYAGKVVAAEPDRATTARVDAVWNRIERWLAAKAPRTRGTLRPPASRARIAASQTRMSVAFPADLVASLRRHDGATAVDGFDLPPFYRLLTLEEMVLDWEITCSVLASDAPDDEWWHRSFVPFASAGDGGCLLVDQRPSGHGRVGEFYPEDGTGFDDWPASITELLEGVARSLETGEPYAGRYRPTVDAERRLDWAIEMSR
ncbi:SMI1/KNR4 family protein [Plantactinospora solaniradicis]|uniref:SMI1/KNR4 family protein n=1 Tax=Plantactinospora solaniradicis TaxID=1723736 RepID=A0ABW1JYV5_9ACTN